MGFRRRHNTVIMRKYIHSLLLFVFVVTADAQLMPRPTRQVPYSILTNIELIIDAKGLATNTNNAYGTVDGSNVITAIKSVLPGPTGRDFSVIGSGVTYDPTTKSIAFNGSGRLRSGSAATTWNFLNYNAVLANLKYTIFAVVKFGNTYRPSATYALLGTDGTSSSNVGASFQYGNASAASVDNIAGRITWGTSANFINTNVSNNFGKSNKYFVLTIKVDMAAGSATRMRYYINDQIGFFPSATQNGTTPVSTPTYTLEIGGGGNSVLPLTGNIKEIIMVREAVSDPVREQIVRALVNKHGIEVSDASYVNKDDVTIVTRRLQDSRYHLSAVMGQNPLSPLNYVSVWGDGLGHLSLDRKLSGSRSTNGAYPLSSSWSATSTVWDPVSPVPLDGGGGYDHNGRFTVMYDAQVGSVPTQTHSTWQINSDDNGLTWNTPIDLTSSMPANGLVNWRFYGGMITNNGVWLKPFYMGNNDFTNSGVYVFRSTDGNNWTPIEVKAPSATYINEGWIVALNNTDLVLICRNEATQEWTRYVSTDNGLTWGAGVDETFGLTITSANPLCLKWFNHKGVRIIVAYVPDRNNDVLYAYYARADTFLSTGWDMDTKTTIWKTSTTGAHLHYGDVVHRNNTFNAVGVFPYDTYPGSGGTENELHYFTLQAWQLALIETELGL